MNPRRRRRLRGQRPHRASGRWSLFTCQRLTQGFPLKVSPNSLYGKFRDIAPRTPVAGLGGRSEYVKKGEPIAYDISSSFPRAMVESHDEEAACHAGDRDLAFGGVDVLGVLLVTLARLDLLRPGSCCAPVAKPAPTSQQAEAKLATLRAEVEAKKKALAKALRPTRTK